MSEEVNLRGTQLASWEATEFQRRLWEKRHRRQSRGSSFCILTSHFECSHRAHAITVLSQHTSPPRMPIARVLQRRRVGNDRRISSRSLCSCRASLCLAEYPMCLRPIPKLRELRRRLPAGLEVFPMLNQHFREIHSVSGDAARIRAALEQV